LATSIRAISATSRSKDGVISEGLAAGSPFRQEKEVRLDVSTKAASDLTALARLPPDGLQGINLCESAVTDAGLANIRNLTACGASIWPRPKLVMEVLLI